MKRLTILTGLVAATALAGCSNVTPVDTAGTAITSVVPLTTTANSNVALAGTPIVTRYAATTSGYRAIPTPMTYQQPHYAPAPAPAPAPVTPYVTTPLAVHAGVPSPHGPSNAMVYNGHNGVRPFLVQSGAVWSGPSTYMLPLGATPGTHQHVETVSADYAQIGSTITHSTVEKADHGHRHATASRKLFIRKAPSKNAEKCKTIPAGKRASVFDCSGGWCKVSYNGTSGYASQRYLNFID